MRQRRDLHAHVAPGHEINIYAFRVHEWTQFELAMKVRTAPTIYIIINVEQGQSANVECAYGLT
jgi:hypothetical protein